MNYDTEIQIYSSPLNLENNGVIYGDFQDYMNEITVENIKFNITKRVFADYTSLINQYSYLKINNSFYKIMRIQEFDNYVEIWLYKSQRSVN